MKALIAELVAGEIARACGLQVPEIVFAHLDPDLARTEPDPEIQDLIRVSPGLNLALDYLPGALNFDPLADRPDATVASAVVWLDALVTNIDRTPRNPNMMTWHRRLWLIDHGAALFFHHAPATAESIMNRFLAKSRSPFPQVKDHVLLPSADLLEEADDRMAALLTPEAIEEVVGHVPDLWLTGDPPTGEAGSIRDAYVTYLLARLEPPRPFMEEAIRARGGG